jgi:hypothetical protein
MSNYDEFTLTNQLYKGGECTTFFWITKLTPNLGSLIYSEENKQKTKYHL